MNTTQQLILFVGIGVAVAVYVVWKIVQSRMGARPSRPEPKMRPPGTSRPPESESSDSLAQTPRQPAEAPKSTEKPAKAQPQPVLAATQSTTDDEFEEFPYADKSDYVFGPITPVLAAMAPASEQARSKETRDLRNAGFYSPHAWQNFSAYRYLAIMLPIVACGLLLVIAPESLEAWLMISLIALPFAGWALPGIYIQNKAQTRRQKIANGMPDMLDLLNMCVSQGMTMPRSLQRVSRDIAPVYPDLAKELKIVTEQARVGSLEQALINFSSRVDVPEVHSLTSLLAQTERLGTSVSNALEDYSDSIRTTMRQRADEKANSAAFKLLFPTVFCLMPAVYLFLMGPAVVQLSEFYETGIEALDTSAAVDVLNNGN